MIVKPGRFQPGRFPDVEQNRCQRERAVGVGVHIILARRCGGRICSQGVHQDVGFHLVGGGLTISETHHPVTDGFPVFPRRLIDDILAGIRHSVVHRCQIAGQQRREKWQELRGLAENALRLTGIARRVGNTPAHCQIIGSDQADGRNIELRGKLSFIELVRIDVRLGKAPLFQSVPNHVQWRLLRFRNLLANRIGPARVQPQVNVGVGLIQPIVGAAAELVRHMHDRRHARQAFHQRQRLLVIADEDAQLFQPQARPILDCRDILREGFLSVPRHRNVITERLTDCLPLFEFGGQPFRLRLDSREILVRQSPPVKFQPRRGQVALHQPVVAFGFLDQQQQGGVLDGVLRLEQLAGIKLEKRLERLQVFALRVEGLLPARQIAVLRAAQIRVESARSLLVIERPIEEGNQHAAFPVSRAGHQSRSFQQCRAIGGGFRRRAVQRDNAGRVIPAGQHHHLRSPTGRSAGRQPEIHVPAFPRLPFNPRNQRCPIKLAQSEPIRLRRRHVESRQRRVDVGAFVLQVARTDPVVPNEDDGLGAQAGGLPEDIGGGQLRNHDCAFKILTG